MTKRKKPRVHSPCFAERVNRHGHTRIIEFGGSTDERGGLIEFRDLDGHMIVIPYSLGKDVKVNVNPDALWLTDYDWERLEAIVLARKSNKLAAETLANLKNDCCIEDGG